MGNVRHHHHHRRANLFGFPPEKQNSDGSRQPTPLELEVATAQGKMFYETVAKAHGGA